MSSAQHPSLPTASLLTYEYDAVGNRVRRDSTAPTIPSAAHAYDGNNRLLSDRYDANGNTTNAFVFTPLTGQTNEVFDRFDFEDRLFERTTTLNFQPATIHLLYDGDGNRVAKTVVGANHTNTTLYVVDDLNSTGYAQVIEELTSVNGGSFAVTRVYTWGHALLSQDQVTGDGQGGLTWSASFPGHDGQGSVRFLTDTNGVVTDTFDFDAFGNLIARTGATPNNYLFRGEQFDLDLNFYYLRARYHNPATGRFWTADTFEGFASDPASQHPYTFNQNDPVNRLDPSGHISLTETLQVSGLAPLVRGAFLNVWDGVNNFSYGMAGGNALKFTTREEAYFIDSLAVGPGWKFGKPNFWAAAKGAPFLLSLNPNIWHSAKPCGYRCIPFDLDVQVYGPGAQFSIFEFEESPLYSFAEHLADFGHGGLIGAELRDAARYWHGISSDNWIWNGSAHTLGSLLDVAAGVVSPAEVIESLERSQHRAELVMHAELESGSSQVWALLQGTSSVVGDFVGYNGVLELIYGVDRETGVSLRASDRWSRGLAGGSQLLLTAVGVRSAILEARMSTAVSRAVARAERKVAALEELNAPRRKDAPTAPKALTTEQPCLQKPLLTKDTWIPDELKRELNNLEAGRAEQMRRGEIADDQAHNATSYAKYVDELRALESVPELSWQNGIKVVGDEWENLLELELGKETRLPRGFEIFDFYDPVTGVATSAKTLNTATRSRLLQPERVFRIVEGYVNDIVDFTGAIKSGQVVRASDVSEAILRLAVPEGTTPAQWVQIEHAIDYGRINGIKVIVTKLR